MLHRRFLILFPLAGIFFILLAGGRPEAAPSLAALKGGKVKTESGRQTADAPSATPTPDASGDDIDGRIKALQESVAEAQRLLSMAKADLTTSALILLGATNQEYDQRAQMARALAYEYERHIEAFNRLRKVRGEKLDDTEQNEQIQALLRQGTQSIDQIDDLRGQIQDARSRISTLEIRRTMNDNDKARATQDLKNAGAQMRQIQEKLDGTKNRVDENRLNWQKELAQLAERLARARLASCETSRLGLEEDLVNQRRQLALLGRKLDIAAANAPFTKKELDAKLEKLRDATRQMQQEMDKAAAARDSALRKLDEARSALRTAREQLAAAAAPSAAVPGAAGVTPTPAPTAKATATPAQTPAVTPGGAISTAAATKLSAKLTGLQAVADLRKNEADTATAVYNVCRILTYYLDTEQTLWQVRQRNTNPNNPQQYDEIQNLIADTSDKTTQFSTFFQNNLDQAASQIAEWQTRSQDWKPENGDIKVIRQMLETLQARTEAYRRGLDRVRRIERLVRCWREEVDDRLSHVTFAQRLEHFSRRTQSLVGNLWNFELIAGSETSTVDGRVVTTKQYSITVGKIIKALFVLLAGIWICRRIAETVRRLAKVRLRARDNSLGLLYKLVFGSGLTLVVLVTMQWLQIPLTIFAFLGGALAIGIGFGAQTLINNFISGLILMFERPIKVGDIVEVDGHRGKVVAIGGRCSRVKRFDGIDILIPNSSFLEKSVINWTLSDLLLRLSVRVGVAYGSPPREVIKLLSRAVEDHGQVLKEPAPVVVFDDFGENAMLFSAYFWVEQRDGIDSRIIASDIRCRIDKLLGEAGIVMAFPQRDVHLDATRPIQVNLLGGAGRPAPSGTEPD